MGNNVLGQMQPTEAQYGMRPDASQRIAAMGGNPDLGGGGFGQAQPQIAPFAVSGMDRQADMLRGDPRNVISQAANGGPAQGPMQNPNIKMALAQMMSRLGQMGR